MQACEVAGGDSSAFYESGEPARPADAAWVARFRANSSFTRFAPHITIGIGPRQLSVDPFQFTARELAVCHLGGTVPVGTDWQPGRYNPGIG